MLNVFYLNNKGDRIDFDGSNYLITSLKDLINYAWKYSVNDYSNRISGFQTGTAESEIKIITIGQSKSDLNFSIKKMEDVFGSDIVEETEGKLYVNEFYLPCFIVACSDVTYSNDKKMCKREYKLVSYEKLWIKATLYKNAGSNGLGYEYLKDYSVENMATKQLVALTNNTVRKADYSARMKLRSVDKSWNLQLMWAKENKIVDEMVDIAEQHIVLDQEITESDVVELNTKDKTVRLLLDNDYVNIFGSRNLYFDYVFSQIDSGTHYMQGFAEVEYSEEIKKFNTELAVVLYEYYMQPEMEE